MSCTHNSAHKFAFVDLYSYNTSISRRIGVYFRNNNITRSDIQSMMQKSIPVAAITNGTVKPGWTEALNRWGLCNSGGCDQDPAALGYLETVSKVPVHTIWFWAPVCPSSSSDLISGKIDLVPFNSYTYTPIYPSFAHHVYRYSFLTLFFLILHVLQILLF